MSETTGLKPTDGSKESDDLLEDIKKVLEAKSRGVIVLNIDLAPGGEFSILSNIESYEDTVRYLASCAQSAVVDVIRSVVAKAPEEPLSVAQANTLH